MSSKDLPDPEAALDGSGSPVRGRDHKDILMGRRAQGLPEFLSARDAKSSIDKNFDELHRLVLDACKEERKDALENWKSLDVKAQGLGAIAGIFLAAIFSWAKDKPHFEPLELAVVLGSAALLIWTILEAVNALQVKEVRTPLGGKEVGEMASGMLASTLETAGLGGFYSEQADICIEAIKDIKEALSAKGNHVSRGQKTVAVAAVLVGFLACISILTGDERHGEVPNLRKDGAVQQTVLRFS